MTLKQWLENSWLRQHKTKPREITDLLQIVARDLKDAGEHHISSDWRFGIAYNAALKLCTILLYAEGYRSERTLQHYRTIQALPLNCCGRLLQEVNLPSLNWPERLA